MVLCSCSTGRQPDKAVISYDSIQKIISSGKNENFLPLRDSSKINRQLMQQLTSILKVDQGPRDFRKDSSIVAEVTNIIDKNGWLGVDIVGHLGNMTLFLVIQHADINVQEKYLPIMRQAVLDGKAEARALAFLEDRHLLRHGKKQFYGSQVDYDKKTGKPILAPIEDEPNVNNRRISIGLEPLEEYLKQWGIIYKPSTK